MVNKTTQFRKNSREFGNSHLLLLLGITLIILLGNLQILNSSSNKLQNISNTNYNFESEPEDNYIQMIEPPIKSIGTRSDLEYHDLINYDDVLVVRNTNSLMSMQIADYFVTNRNIPSINICDITTSTSETINRDTFENEIRAPVEDHIINNGLLGQINYIVTTKGVPLRISPDSHSWDCACVDSDLALILGPYQSSIGQPYWINNPYFDPDPYDDFSRSRYGFFLVTRLTGFDFDDIQAIIDKAEISIGRKGTLVLDLDPGKDGGGYQEGNDWMRAANATLTANGFDVFLDETNTFWTNCENVSGYTSWGSNDGHYLTNSLINSGLENDGNGDGVPDSWYFVEDEEVGSCERNDTEVRSGAWSVKITRNATGMNSSNIAQNITVKPDTRYYGVGYVNLSGVSSDWGIYLQVIAYDFLGNPVRYHNGTKRTGTTDSWVSLGQVIYEPLPNITKISVGVVLSQSSGTVFVDDIYLYEIKPRNQWIPGALAETYVSTGGRSFNYPTSYGQSLVADLIKDGVTGVKGYVYEPYLSACAHPDILFDAYTQGFCLAESYYMASAYLSWMDVVVGDPKLAPYDLNIVPDLAIFSHNISFSDSAPHTGEIVNISVTIENLGQAPALEVEVKFYAGDPFFGGTFIGSRYLSFQGLSINETWLNWDSTGYLGHHNITLLVDAQDRFYEMNESNNMANKKIVVHTGYPCADAGSDSVLDEDEPHQFDGSGSIDNSSIANYTWDFGDGKYGYGVGPTHSYTIQGFYTVILNVTNVFGLWDLDSVDITVNNVVPTAYAGEDKTGFEGQILNFSAMGSTDSPSDIYTLNYTWYFGDGNIGFGKNITYAYFDNGSFIVCLEVRDDDMAVAIDTLNVTISNVAPHIAFVPSQIVLEDSLFILIINASDVIGDTITFSDNSTIFDINSSTGEIYFMTSNENVGVHFIKITASDEDGGENYTEFVLTVENTNDPPYIISVPETTAIEGEMFYYDVVVEDDDLLVSPTEEITYSLESSPPGMEIDIYGVITWVPTDAQASLIFNVIINVSDGQEYDTQIFEITVINVNDKPVINSTPITTALEGENYIYDVNATDPDPGEVFSFMLDLAPEGMNIDEVNGLIYWLPTNDQIGIVDVIVNVTDLAGDFDTQSFYIWVSNVNDAPVIEYVGDLFATEDEYFYYKVNATDFDLYDSITFYDDSELFDIGKKSGIISFTSTNEDVGVYTIKITVLDNEKAEDFEIIIFTVLNVNDPPILDFIGDWILTEDENFTLMVTASDIDVGDSLMYQDNSTLFDIDTYSGEISFTPTNDDVGTHIINISVLDGNGGMDYQIVRFIIKNVNDPPFLKPSDNLNLSVGVTIKVGETFSVKVNVSDMDIGDTLIFSDDSDMFDINPRTGEIIFTPTKDDIGVHYVNISVKDSNGDTDYMIVKFEIPGEEGEREEGIGPLWLVLLIILVIIIILILLFGWNKKKSASHENEILFVEIEGEIQEEIEKKGEEDFPPYPPLPPPPPPPSS